MPKTYSIELSDERDMGLSHVAAQEGKTNQEYLEMVLGNACDSWCRAKTTADEAALLEKFRSADAEKKAAAEAALEPAPES